MFIPKPFTVHSPQDYVLTTGDKVSGFLHLTQRVITQLLHQADGIPAELAAITQGGLLAATTSRATESG